MVGLVPPLLLEAPKRAVKLWVQSGFFSLYHDSIDVMNSAANDFWGNTYLSLSGEAKMTQQLSILTGCSAGATESFVVVPFELVKIKYVLANHVSLLSLDVIQFPMWFDRLQDKSSTFSGPVDVLKQVVKKEGLLGLYVGMESTFWRYVTVPFSTFSPFRIHLD